ncbi:MAG TPA: hypothetical protein VIL74_08815 [Pyrinomonadaceae bacterium]|jgi:hypothetical protein
MKSQIERLREEIGWHESSKQTLKDIIKAHHAELQNIDLTIMAKRACVKALEEAEPHFIARKHRDLVYPPVMVETLPVGAIRFAEGEDAGKQP